MAVAYLRLCLVHGWIGYFVGYINQKEQMKYPCNHGVLRFCRICEEIKEMNVNKMKLTKYELEAERRYRFTEAAKKLFGCEYGDVLTAEQITEIDKLIEPDMEALRKFEYEE